MQQEQTWSNFSQTASISHALTFSSFGGRCFHGFESPSFQHDHSTREWRGIVITPRASLCCKSSTTLSCFSFPFFLSRTHCFILGKDPFCSSNYKVYNKTLSIRFNLIGATAILMLRIIKEQEDNKFAKRIQRGGGGIRVKRLWQVMSKLIPDAMMLVWVSNSHAEVEPWGSPWSAHGRVYCSSSVSASPLMISSFQVTHSLSLSLTRKIILCHSQTSS